MKKLFCILRFALAIIMSSDCFGQVQNTDTLLFIRAVELGRLIDELYLDQTIVSKDTLQNEGKIRAEFASKIKDEILGKELDYYTEIVDSFPKSCFLLPALNNKGTIEFELEEYTDAKKSFLAILNSAANDKEPVGIGSGLMAEPYANYKNRAAQYLAEICIINKQYTQGLKYLAYTKKYPYQHFCGNALATDEIYMAMLYAKCYLGQKNYSLANKTLLPYIIEDGLADNSDLVYLAYKTLLKTYNKAELKRLFESAVNHCQIDVGDFDKGISSGYSMTFLGVEIYRNTPLQFEFINNKVEQRQSVKALLLKSKFYKLLSAS